MTESKQLVVLPEKLSWVERRANTTSFIKAEKQARKKSEKEEKQNAKAKTADVTSQVITGIQKETDASKHYGVVTYDGQAKRIRKSSQLTEHEFLTLFFSAVGGIPVGIGVGLPLDINFFAGSQYEMSLAHYLFGSPLTMFTAATVGVVGAGATIATKKHSLVVESKKIKTAASETFNQWLVERYGIRISARTAKRLSKIYLDGNTLVSDKQRMFVDSYTGHPYQLTTYGSSVKVTIKTKDGLVEALIIADQHSQITSTMKSVSPKKKAITVIHDNRQLSVEAGKTRASILHKLAVLEEGELGYEAEHAVSRIRGSLELALSTHERMVKLGSKEKDLNKTGVLFTALLEEVNLLLEQQQEDMVRKLAIETEYTLAHQDQK